MLTRRDNLKLLMGASVLAPRSNAGPADFECPSCSGDSATKFELGDVLDAAPILAFGSQPPSLSELTTSGRNGLSLHFVNSATGTLSFEVNDISLHSTPPISLSRTYSSGNDRDSGLGVGWSFGFDDVISISGETAILRMGNGENVEMRRVGAVYVPVSPGLTHHRQVRTMGDRTLREDVDSSRGLARIYSSVNGLFHLTAIEMGDYGTISINVAPNGKVASISNNSSRLLLRWSSEASPHLLSVSDNTGRSVDYSYENGSLVSVTDPAGGLWTYVYERSDLTRALDPEGRTSLAVAYVGTQVASVDSSAGHSEYSYAGYGLTTVTNGHDQIALTHNPNGQVTAYGPKSRPLFATLKYDDQSRLIEHNQGRARKTWDYDDQGQLVHHFSAGSSLRWTYDNAGRIASHSVNGIAQTFRYDESGRIIASLSMDSDRTYQTSHAPSAHGHLITHKSGPHTVSMEYDTLGLPSAYVADGKRFEYANDSHGWIVGTRDSDGYEIIYSRNARGQVASRKDSTGRQLTYTRDRAGFLKRVDSSDGLWVEATRDSRGRIVKLANAFGQTREFVFHNDNRLASFKDALDRLFTIVYSTTGEALRMVQQNGTLRMSRVMNKAQDLSRRALPKWYHDGWQDPAEAHSLLGSFNDGIAGRISNAGAAIGRQDIDSPMGPAGASPLCASVCNVSLCRACTHSVGVNAAAEFTICFNNAKSAYKYSHVHCLKWIWDFALYAYCEAMNLETFLNQKEICENTRNAHITPTYARAQCYTQCLDCEGP